MLRLRADLHETLPSAWQHFAQELAQPYATVDDSLRLLAAAYTGPTPPDICYQGELRPEAVTACMAARMAREKMLLRVKLAQLEQEIKKHRPDGTKDQPAQFGLTEIPATEPDLTAMELTLDGTPITPPEDVRQLLTSIQLDLGEIPPEYLVAAGPGEYDPRLYMEKPADPDEVRLRGREDPAGGREPGGPARPAGQLREAGGHHASPGRRRSVLRVP